jgi:aminopeptidase-like protein
VAVKILKELQDDASQYQEFLQEVSIMRKVRRHALLGAVLLVDYICHHCLANGLVGVVVSVRVAASTRSSCRRCSSCARCGGMLCKMRCSYTATLAPISDVLFPIIQ